MVAPHNVIYDDGVNVEPMVSYALGQGATLVATLWGVFVWREFHGASIGTQSVVALMLIGYTVRLIMIGTAIL